MTLDSAISLPNSSVYSLNCSKVRVEPILGANSARCDTLLTDGTTDELGNGLNPDRLSTFETDDEETSLFDGGIGDETLEGEIEFIGVSI